MTRNNFIERCLRQIYGQQPSDDASISYSLVNFWLSDAIGIAAKTNYKENNQIDGIGYVNNSFYTKYKGIPIIADEQFTWRLTLPEVPLGIGRNMGISTLQFVDVNGNVSLPAIPLSENERGLYRSMRPIPGKNLFYPEGIYCYVLSTMQLFSFTATVSMQSGGDSTDLDSVLNVPPDYYPVMTEYIMKQLGFEQSRPQDNANDGQDRPSN